MGNPVDFEVHQQKLQELEKLQQEFQAYKIGAEEIEQEQNELYDLLQLEFNKKEKEYSNIQKQYAQVQQDLQQEKQFSQKLEEKNKSLENQISQLKLVQKKIAELEIENEELKNKNRQLDVDYQSKSTNFDSLCEQIAMLQTDLEENKENSQQQEEILHRLQQDIQEKKEDNFVLEAKLEKVKQEYTQKYEKTIQSLKEQIEILTIENCQLKEDKLQMISYLNSSTDIDHKQQKNKQLIKNTQIHTPNNNENHKKNENNDNNNAPTIIKQKAYSSDNNNDLLTVKQNERYSQQSDELQSTKKLNNANTELEESQPQSLHTFSASSQHIHNTNLVKSCANPQFLTEDGGTQNTSNCPTPPNIGYKLKIQQEQQQQSSTYSKRIIHNKRQASVDLDFQKRINNTHIISPGINNSHVNQQRQYRELCVKQKSQSSVTQQQFLSQQKQQSYILDEPAFNQFSPSSKSQKSGIRCVQTYSPSLDKIQINSIGLKSSIDLVASIIKDIDIKMKRIKKLGPTPNKQNNNNNQTPTINQ